jgi:hypothetical protein
MAQVIVDADPGVGHDYTSLDAMDTGEASTLSEVLTVLCRTTNGGADTTEWTASSSWETSSSYYLHVKADTGHRHAGKWDATKARMDLANMNGLNDSASNIDHIIIEGMQFRLTGNTQWEYCLYLAAPEVEVRECIFLNTASAKNRYGLRTNSAGELHKISNCLAYDFNTDGSYGFHLSVAAAQTFVYNCTAADNTNDFYANSTSVIFKNCVAQGAGTNFASGGGVDNVSEDATAPGTGSDTSKVIVFASEGTDDFHLHSSDTWAKDQGTDLSGDGDYPITIDIDGATRTGTWDRGCDEITAAPPARRVFIC